MRCNMQVHELEHMHCAWRGRNRSGRRDHRTHPKYIDGRCGNPKEEGSWPCQRSRNAIHTWIEKFLKYGLRLSIAQIRCIALIDSHFVSFEFKLKVHSNNFHTIFIFIFSAHDLFVTAAATSEYNEKVKTKMRTLHTKNVIIVSHYHCEHTNAINVWMAKESSDEWTQHLYIEKKKTNITNDDFWFGLRFVTNGRVCVHSECACLS